MPFEQQFVTFTSFALLRTCIPLFQMTLNRTPLTSWLDFAYEEWRPKMSWKLNLQVKWTEEGDDASCENRGMLQGDRLHIITSPHTVVFFRRLRQLRSSVYIQELTRLNFVRHTFQLEHISWIQSCDVFSQSFNCVYIYTRVRNCLASAQADILTSRRWLLYNSRRQEVLITNTRSNECAIGSLMVTTILSRKVKVSPYALWWQV